MPRIALYAGSFDPVTNGHIDVVRQAARLADTLVLAIGIHPGKTPLFPAAERRAMLEETCTPLAKEAGCKLDFVTFDGLIVVAARLASATILIRGRRGGGGGGGGGRGAGGGGAGAPGGRAGVL